MQLHHLNYMQNQDDIFPNGSSMCTMMQKEGTRILYEPKDISILFDGLHAGANISQGDVCNLPGKRYMENKEELIDSFLQDIPVSSSSLEGDFLEINDLASGISFKCFSHSRTITLLNRDMSHLLV